MPDCPAGELLAPSKMHGIHGKMGVSGRNTCPGLGPRQTFGMHQMCIHMDVAPSGVSFFSHFVASVTGAARRLGGTPGKYEYLCRTGVSSLGPDLPQAGPTS